MNDADIRAIESEIGFELPATYRQFLLDHAAAIADRVRWGEENEGAYQNVYPYCQVDDVVGYNSGDRSGFGIHEDQEPGQFCDRVVFIADNTGGDFWFIYREPSRTGVWLLSEVGEATLEFPDLESYFQSLVMDFEQP
jgi:hypothetical protein